MALQSQEIDVNFSGGVDTKSDERLVVPTKLTLLENASLDKTGALLRRDAWHTLASQVISTTTAAALPALNGLTTYEDQLLAVGGENLYAYLPTDGKAELTGAISPCTVTKSRVYQPPQYFVGNIDSAAGPTYTCHVWSEWGVSARGGTILIAGLFATVIDTTTGAVLLPRTQVSAENTDTFARVAFVTGAPSAAPSFLIAYREGTSTFVRAIDMSSSVLLPVLSSAASISGIESGSQCALRTIGGSVALLANIISDGTSSMNAVTLKAMGGSTAPAVVGSAVIAAQADVASTKIMGVAVEAFTATKAGVYFVAQTTGLHGVVMNVTASAAPTVAVARATLDASSAPTAAHACGVTAALNGTTMRVYADKAADGFAATGAGALLTLRCVGVDVTNSITVAAATFCSSTNSTTFENGPFIAGGAFTTSGVTYLPVYVGNVAGSLTTPPLQQTWLLMDQSARVVARALYGVFGMYHGTSTIIPAGVPSTIATGTSTFAVGAPETGTLTFAAGVASAPVGASVITMAFAGPPHPRARVGASLFVGGGMVSGFDGLAPTESSFPLFPEAISLAQATTGGNIDGGSVLQYVACYEWLDGQGQRHQSAPSVAASITVAGTTGSTATNTVTVTVPSLLLSQKANINIAIYRTLNGGTTFYRVNTIQAPNANNTAAASVAFVDTLADATISGQGLLYTVGGVLNNNAPGSASILFAHQNRLWMAGLEDPQEFRYSQQAVTGVGLQFNETLSGRLPGDAGAITAGASMDDKAILFTATGIYVVFGNGPNSTGAQNGYSDPQKLASDVGCRDPRSVIAIPQGLLFMSGKGFHLLSRGMTVSYVGGDVEAYSGATVTSAVMLEDRRQIRFSLADGPGSTVDPLTGGSQTRNVVLAFDYANNQWGVFGNYAAADACVWSGRYTHCTPTGLINQDVPGNFLDAGTTPIVMRAKTAWIHLGGLQGFQRVYRLLLLGPYLSRSTLLWSVAYDYGQDIGAGGSVDTSTLLGNGSTVFQLRSRLARQRCEAIQFLITDTPTTTNPQGVGLTSLGLEIGVKKGAMKLRAGQSA